MRKRIFRSMLTIVVSLFLLCYGLIFMILYQYVEKDSIGRLQSEATYLAPGIEMQGVEYLKKIPLSENRISIVANNGEVLYDSYAKAETMENHKDREEIMEALEKGEGQSERYSSTLSEKTFYYATKLNDGQVLRIARTRASLLTLMLSLSSPMLLILVGELALAAYIAYKISDDIVSPINQMDLDRPEKTKTYEEFVPIIRRLTQQKKELKDQMDLLEEQKIRMDMMTENMSEGFLMIDHQSRVLSYNPALLKLLDIDFPVDGEPALIINRDPSFRLGIETALSGENYNATFSFGTRVFQMFSSPVYFNQKLLGAVVLLVDISEKADRENLRREFTANVSHELKTPLTGILGAAELLKNNMVQPEDVLRFYDNLHQQAQRMIHLIEDLINLSRIDEGAPASQSEDVDLMRIGREVIDEMENVAEEKDITLSLDGDNAQITGYPTIVKEIFVNVIENAIKYNTNGGKVAVYIQDGDHPVVTIEDDGIGIPIHLQDRVFERFYRIDASRSDKVRGSGLGLAIVKNGMNLHKGKIELSSAYGKGTTVKLHFPAKKI
ncbi:MAG: histidine kinase [Eubacteriaceae bacterium]|nr:histidine kinase [Eubacteriaceae bacterium]